MTMTFFSPAVLPAFVSVAGPTHVITVQGFGMQAGDTVVIVGAATACSGTVLPTAAVGSAATLQSAIVLTVQVGTLTPIPTAGNYKLRCCSPLLRSPIATQ